jgi:hypothetical protein
MFCTGFASVQAAGHTFNLSNVASGNWNDQNQRQSNNYQIGKSTERPRVQAAYFVFDLTPAKGKHITSANMLIVGSTDYNVTTVWPGHSGVNFKAGMTPMTVSRNSVSQIMTGNNIASLYHDQCSGSPDNGYGWVPDGLHRGFRFDAWHYESTLGRGNRLQNGVNAGGLFVVWAVDRFGVSQAGENYIWGSTSFNSGNQLQIITSD